MELHAFLKYAKRFATHASVRHTQEYTGAIELFDRLLDIEERIHDGREKEISYDAKLNALLITRRRMNELVSVYREQRRDTRQFDPRQFDRADQRHPFMQSVIRLMADPALQQWQNKQTTITFTDEEERILGPEADKDFQGVLAAYSTMRGRFYFCIATTHAFITRFAETAKVAIDDNYVMKGFTPEEQINELGLPRDLKRRLSLRKTKDEPIAERWDLTVEYAKDPEALAVWDEINKVLISTLQEHLNPAEAVTPLFTTDLVKNTTTVKGLLFIHWSHENDGSPPRLVLHGKYAELIPISPEPILVHWVIDAYTEPISPKEQRENREWPITMRQRALWTDLTLQTSIRLENGELPHEQTLNITAGDVVVARATIDQQLSFIKTRTRKTGTPHPK